jgi:hypothetical protein
MSRFTPRGLSISLKEMRIAKISKKNKINPCTAELEAYINALADFGEDRMPIHVAKALVDCSDLQVRNLLYFCEFSDILRIHF